jgi:hypothetical protein
MNTKQTKVTNDTERVSSSPVLGHDVLLIGHRSSVAIPGFSGSFADLVESHNFPPFCAIRFLESRVLLSFRVFSVIREFRVLKMHLSDSVHPINLPFVETNVPA